MLLSSCTPAKNNDGAEAMEVKIYNEWLYAFKINNLLANTDIITRPPGIEQLIISLLIPNSGGIGFKTHCVYYQVPYKKIAGHLKIEELKKSNQCGSISRGEPWLQLDDVSDLSIKLENFKLNLNFKFKKEKTTWEFLFPNIQNGLTHEKYQAVKEKKLYPGMSFLKISDETFDTINNKYLGKLSDRMSKGSAIRCSQVNKLCQLVGEDRCDECRYGWYQVVDYNCPQGGSRFCGQNHCGEKNEPACIRGTKVNEGEDQGICQNDLGPVMNADHILICQ